MTPSPRTLFVIHRFDTKSLADSAGVLEVMKPMLASGLIGEHRLVTLGRDTDDYRALIARRVSEIAQASCGAPVVIYGAGAHTRQFLPELGRLPIVALADRDESLHGTQRLGLPVIAPSEIPRHAAQVVISSRAYEEGIAADLAELHGERITLHTLYRRNPDGELRELWEGEILDAVREFQPDLLVHTPVHPHENIAPTVFHTARALCPGMKIVTLWWDYDETALTGSYLDYERASLEWADLVIENSNGTRLARMKAHQPPYQQHRHTERVFFHPTVFDPALFHPEPHAEIRYEIALFGSSVGRRREWIDLLTARYGQRFHHLGGVYEPGRPPLPVAEYAAALRHTRICVNTQTYPFRSQCKGKVREALGCGVLLLEEDNPETRLLLAPGEGIEYFRDADALFALIDHYLSDEAARRAVVARGQRVWNARMNARGWTEHLLKILSAPKEHAHV
ncbi:glycosyltransferase [Niveibacterium sp. 24ML]|uniref:glycosyltransferase family protein n=1 Tax=Niveibacterium sp. 24ML TaxID=2985512 RepID=UPI002271D0C1|nr:glycosyltransferase [Niveibacterium sp. 24ML]MCX9156188.1 glycosyltransferase [Niveibacterium sp. 24ML]